MTERLRIQGATATGGHMRRMLPLTFFLPLPLQAAHAAEWAPASGHEPTLGEMATSLATGGSAQALLLLASALACLLAGLQVLGNRS